jgi:ubiquinol-cytochrome c reductase cytochrome c subunit
VRARRSLPVTRAVMALMALVCAGGALYSFASPRADAQKGSSLDPVPAPPPSSAAQRDLIATGRSLFLEACSSCHGETARGNAGLAPSLHGAGAAAADFYLSTGRMPLANPTDEPTRAEPIYSRPDIDALTAYVGSLGAGPPIPKVDPAAGDLSRGMEAFTLRCAGCHQVGARGGIVTGAIAPPLQDSSATEIAEAVRVGPYLMPAYNERQVSDAELNSIVRYVLSTRHPDDRGGWGIGHIGPIPEGMIAWLLAGTALLLVARLIGERNPA